MLGQLKIEFIFSVVVFALVLFFVVSQINTLFTAIIADSEADISKSVVMNAMTVLLEDPGDPQDWETIAQSNPEDVKRVGLAIEPYVLSRQKIFELNRSCGLLHNYSLVDYTLYIFNSTDRMLTCGYETPSAPMATITKYALVDNEVVNVTLQVR